jgi:hypothetical protein
MAAYTLCKRILWSGEKGRGALETRWEYPRATLASCATVATDAPAAATDAPLQEEHACRPDHQAVETVVHSLNTEMMYAYLGG